MDGRMKHRYARTSRPGVRVGGPACWVRGVIRSSRTAWCRQAAASGVGRQVTDRRRRSPGRPSYWHPAWSAVRRNPHLPGSCSQRRAAHETIDLPLTGLEGGAAIRSPLEPGLELPQR